MESGFYMRKELALLYFNTRKRRENYSTWVPDSPAPTHIGVMTGMGDIHIGPSLSRTLIPLPDDSQDVQEAHQAIESMQWSRWSMPWSPAPFSSSAPLLVVSVVLFKPWGSTSHTLRRSWF